MSAVRKEILEAFNAITAPVDGDPIGWALEAANQLVDVLGVVIASLDDVNKAADLAALRVEVIAAATELSARIELPWGLGMAVPTIAGALVDQLGQFSGSVEQFKQTRILPALMAIEEFGRRGIALLPPQS